MIIVILYKGSMLVVFCVHKANIRRLYANPKFKSPHEMCSTTGEKLWLVSWILKKWEVRLRLFSEIKIVYVTQQSNELEIYK